MPQIQVAGTVNSIAWEGKRIQIWERFESNGKDFSRLWTCWFSESQAWNLQEQDWAEIHGDLSTKIGSYKNKEGVEKTVVEHHIQNAQLVQVKSVADQEAHSVKFADTPVMSLGEPF